MGNWLQPNLQPALGSLTREADPHGGERRRRWPPGPARPSSTCSGSALPRSRATWAAGPGSAGPLGRYARGLRAAGEARLRPLGAPVAAKRRARGRQRQGRGGSGRRGGAACGRWEVASRRARAAARGRRIRTAEGALLAGGGGRREGRKQGKQAGKASKQAGGGGG